LKSLKFGPHIISWLDELVSSILQTGSSDMIWTSGDIFRISLDTKPFHTPLSMTTFIYRRTIYNTRNVQKGWQFRSSSIWSSSLVWHTTARMVRHIWRYPLWWSSNRISAVLLSMAFHRSPNVLKSLKFGPHIISWLDELVSSNFSRYSRVISREEHYQNQANFFKAVNSYHEFPPLNKEHTVECLHKSLSLGTEALLRVTPTGLGIDLSVPVTALKKFAWFW
jgi:hypothetical protein